MSKKDDLQKLIERRERRLQRRREQESVYGINTPPEVSIEIEDLETEIEKLQAELVAMAEEESEEAGAAQPPPAEPPEETGSLVQNEPAPAAGPAIQSGTGIELTPSIEAVLRLMFAEYERLHVETEFGQGRTNTRVFRVRSIGDHNFLPVVAKVGPVQLIRREWEAYRKMKVSATMSVIARIDQPPVILSDSDWAGLCYTLAGDAVHKPVSLKQYCQKTDQPKLISNLKRLLKRVSEHWWLHRRTVRRQLRAEYDPLLPVNLMIEPLRERPEGHVHQLRADGPRPTGVASGEAIHLQGFLVTEVEETQVTLNLPAANEDSRPDSYRLRLVKGPAVAQYRAGAVVDSLYGRVFATRQELLVRLAAAAMSDALDLAAGRLRLAIEPDLDYPADLPNPLLAYSAILDRAARLSLSTIHGDLNLENVLVDSSNGEMYLIDFAATRQGHALHDLLHLEQGVVTQLLPPALVEARLPTETIWLLYHQLQQAMARPGFQPQLPHPALEKPFAILQAIRTAARGCLTAPDSWEEYYRGLVVYLLAALKFKDLDALPTAPRPKRVAFWGAAAALALLEAPEEEAEQQQAGHQQEEDEGLPDKYQASTERSEAVTDKQKPTYGVNISGVTGNISGSFAGRDIIQKSYNVGSPLTGDLAKPTLAEIRQLLQEIERKFEIILAEKETLKAVSASAMLDAQGAALEIKAALKKTDTVSKLEDSGMMKRLHKSLNKTVSRVSEVAIDAEEQSEHRLVKRLEALAEQIKQAILVVDKLTL